MSDLSQDDMINFQNKVEAELERFLHRVLEKLRTDAVEIIDSNKANASGEMRRNVRYDIYKEAAKMVGVVGVGSNVPYAIFRHEGTRPHFPPLLPIYEWVVKKGFVKINNKPTTRSRIKALSKARFTKVESELRSIAFLIARKISRRGTKGLDFLRMSLNQNVSWMANELKNLNIA